MMGMSKFIAAVFSLSLCLALVVHIYSHYVEIFVQQKTTICFLFATHVQ